MLNASGMTDAHQRNPVQDTGACAACASNHAAPLQSRAAVRAPTHARTRPAVVSSDLSGCALCLCRRSPRTCLSASCRWHRSMRRAWQQRQQPPSQQVRTAAALACNRRARAACKASELLLMWPASAQLHLCSADLQRPRPVPPCATASLRPDRCRGEPYLLTDAAASMQHVCCS